MSVSRKVERGEKDGLAGIKLCAEIRKNDPFCSVDYPVVRIGKLFLCR